METYYCDGSQHKELNKLGIGIVKGDASLYYDTEEFEWQRSTHEIVAITKAINCAIENKDKHIVVVNDDRHLVQMVQYAKVNMKLKSKGFKKKIEFRRLVSLVKQHDIVVRTPQSEYDKSQILKCHHLSRTYLNELENNEEE